MWSGGGMEERGDFISWHLWENEGSDALLRLFTEATEVRRGGGLG